MPAMSARELSLSRELRFGLHPAPAAGGPEALGGVPAPRSVNGFAGHPALLGLAPFLTLTATVAGQPEPATGMLTNIRVIDEVLREYAVPRLRDFYYADSLPTAPLLGARFPGVLLGELRRDLASRLAPHRLARLTLGLSPYLFLTVDSQEPSMCQVTQRFEFSAAHRLHDDQLTQAENMAIFGKCNNPSGHGHNYELEVTVSGTPDPRTGQVLGIARLQEIVSTRVIERLDHKHLNQDCPEFAGLNPTVENIARVIFEQLDSHVAPAQLRRVRVWETPKTSCAYPAD
jgi:6-pyruvoyltetrahydropterin/6-carboxytetrahydropterin synthase